MIASSIWNDDAFNIVMSYHLHIKHRCRRHRHHATMYRCNNYYSIHGRRHRRRLRWSVNYNMHKDSNIVAVEFSHCTHCQGANDYNPHITNSYFHEYPNAIFCTLTRFVPILHIKKKATIVHLTSFAAIKCTVCSMRSHRIAEEFSKSFIVVAHTHTHKPPNNA